MENMSGLAAVVSLFIVWTVTVIGFATWLQVQFKNVKTEIITDFNKKHEANETMMKAMEKLVMRHDLLLDPEFLEQANKVRVGNGLRHHG